MPRGDHYRKVGEENEQRILELLAGGPMTAKAITAALGRARSKVAVYLQRLHAAPKRIFISGHDAKSKGRPTPIWSLGSLPDVEFVPLNRPARKTSAAERCEQVIALLRMKPRSTRELAEAMHVVYGTACRYVTQLRAPGSRRLFVAKWRHPTELHGHNKGGDWTPVYAVGAREDAVKPTETPEDRNARLRLDASYMEQRRIYRRSRYRIEKLRKKPNTIFGALGL